MSVVPEFGDNITTYQLGTLLERTGKALQQLPMSAIKNAEEYAVTAIQGLESRLKATLQYLQTFEQRVNEIEEEAYQRSEEAYNKVRDQRDGLVKKLKDLPKINIPDNMNLYELKSFLEVADKLCSMNDRAWERMVRIMELYNARPDDVEMKP